jgi:hypothetical protein
MGDRFSYRYVLLYGTTAASICGVLFALSAPPYFNVIQHSAYILVFWFLYGFSQAAGAFATFLHSMIFTVGRMNSLSFECALPLGWR